MTKLKYKILRQVHKCLPTAPARKSDFLRGKRRIVSISRSIDELLVAELLKQPIGSDILLLTDKGIAHLEAESDRRENFRRITLRYWITTTIALLALAVSIIALLSELGILQLTQC